jgi:death-on-curing protein
VRYLTAEQLLFIHSRIIDETGGSHGVRDVGLLKSAIARPRATFGGNDLYPDILQKAAALMDSVVNNHPFLDGNIRTAVTAVGMFLQLNDFHLTASQKTLVRFTLDVATKKLSIEQAAAWLQKNTLKILR